MGATNILGLRWWWGRPHAIGRGSGEMRHAKPWRQGGSEEAPHLGHLRRRSGVGHGYYRAAAEIAACRRSREVLILVTLFVILLTSCRSVVRNLSSLGSRAARLTQAHTSARTQGVQALGHGVRRPSGRHSCEGAAPQPQHRNLPPNSLRLAHAVVVLRRLARLKPEQLGQRVVRVVGVAMVCTLVDSPRLGRARATLPRPLRMVVGRRAAPDPRPRRDL